VKTAGAEMGEACVRRRAGRGEGGDRLQGETKKNGWKMNKLKEGGKK